jgi:hypothetical protein
MNRSFTTTFNSFTDKIFSRYLLYHSVGAYFTDWFKDIKCPSKNRSSVIYFMSKCPLVKKNPIVLQTGNTHQKNNYPLEYTNEIILSVIGSGIWSTFIPTLWNIW